MRKSQIISSHSLITIVNYETGHKRVRTAGHSGAKEKEATNQVLQPDDESENKSAVDGVNQADW